MPSQAADGRALIVGGGIGGLATGIALAKQGLQSSLFERAAFGDQKGAGIQLGPNATAALRDLGALEAVETVAFRPEAITLFDGISAASLTTMPLGRGIEERFGAPYLSLHRDDLHAALLDVLRGHGTAELRDRFAIAGVENRPGQIVARAAAGGDIEGTCLIAADGLWSSLREAVAPSARLRFSGATAWRAMLPRDQAGAPFDAPNVGLWLGPRTHLVHYPVRGGKELNLVAVVEGGEAEPGWNRETDAGEFLAAFAGWAKPVRELLHAPDWRSWSLYRLPPLSRWSAGRIALLGDAAHPVLPYLAQGAALAIEDAVVLAASLAACGGDPLQAFPRYEASRRFRAAQVQSRSRRSGFFYHLHGPFAALRNLLLKQRHGQATLDSHAWLYGPNTRGR